MNDCSFPSKALLTAFTLQLLCATTAPPAFAANSGLDTPTGVTTLPFSVQGVEMMDLTQSGLGIGTTAPAAALDVDGAIRATGSTTVSGMAYPTVEGNECTPEGAIAYDMTNHEVVYCGSTLIWKSTSAIPSGLIAAFANLACPSGWSEYTASRGLFLRGYDNSAGIDPSGNRTVGNVEADMFASHTHSTNTGFQFYGGVGGAGFAVSLTYSGPNQYNPTTSAAGGPETRPKNIVVMFCSKN